MSDFICHPDTHPPHDAYYAEKDHTHPGAGGMEIHANEYHDPDMALASHNHALNDLSEKSYNSLTDKPSIPAAIGYTIHVQALTSNPVDGATVYFGQLPRAPITTANVNKTRIPKAGTIRRAYIYTYAGVAGTNESWSLYIRLNNTTDTLIQTLTVAAAERIFANDALNISVVAGDYIEIRGVQPTWATNPTGVIYGGHIYIE